jgi:hypothetical protein
MRPLSIPVLLAVLVSLALPSAVGAATYKGKATNMERDFKYGKVTVRTKGAKVTYIEIESVTTSGCNGNMAIVFAPNDPETQIVKGSARIKNGRLSVTYRPVKSIEDQATKISARVTGSKVTGTFESGDLCSNEGRFSAKR